MISKENKLRTIIMRRLTVFFKLVMFWAGIRFSENFTLTDLKFHFDDKPHKTYMKTMIPWHMTEFWKSAIFWVVMALTDNFTVKFQSVVLMVNTVS